MGGWSGIICIHNDMENALMVKMGESECLGLLHSFDKNINDGLNEKASGNSNHLHQLHFGKGLNVGNFSAIPICQSVGKYTDVGIQYSSGHPAAMRSISQFYIIQSNWVHRKICRGKRRVGSCWTTCILPPREGRGETFSKKEHILSTLPCSQSEALLL